MALNRINDGELLEITSASTARTSGDVIIFQSDVFGIAMDTVASGAEYRAFIRGTFELAKNTGVNLTPGEDLYWDGTELTTVQSSNDRIGVVARNASTTAAKGRVILNQPNILLAPQT